MSTIKVKQSGGGSEYLETIPSIQLNQGFQQSLQAAVNKINENFKKLISLPFLQGDHGNSIFETTINIGDGSLGGKLKTAVCQSIYGSNTPNDGPFGGTYFGNSWGGYNGSQTYDGTQIVFYRHKETDEQGEKYFYTSREFFLFIDKRVENLRSANLGSSSLMSAITSFQDLSCALTIFATADADPSTGQPDTDTITFEVKKHSIVPTLYYDSISKYWCWSVNGVKTGVIAQGVKGDTGSSRSIYVCKGVKGTSPVVQEINTILKITNVMQPEQFRNYTQLQFAEHVNEGDLLVVWFKDEATHDSIWKSLDNCTFGIAKKHLITDDNGQVVDGYAYIDNGTTAGNRLDLATIMAETSLYRWLNDICNNEASLSDPSLNPAIRGLYIPNGVPFEGNKVHMLWSEFGSENPVASLGCVDYGARQLNGSASLPTISGDTVSGWSTSDTSALNLWYPTLRCHRGAFYRVMKNYSMVSGVKPANLSDQGLKNYCDPGITSSSLNLARQPEEIASAFSLKGPESEAVKDETVIASSGLYIKRNTDPGNMNDIPSVYIDHGIHGKIYVKGGRITTENSRILIGRKDNAKWVDPNTYFSAKYDGSDPSNSDGGSYNQNVEDSIKTLRWDFSVLEDGTPNYMANPGVKLVSSDIVNHGGMIIVSSDNAYKNVFIKDNKLMFDYKVHAEIGGLNGTPSGESSPVDNTTAVHDRRPRSPEYMGIQLGGYCTVYNTITANSDSSGSVSSTNGILTNPREPIHLTEQKNKEFAFMSGKSGFTVMIENYGGTQGGTMKVDGNFKVQNNWQMTTDTNTWGLITSYDCIWTKVGNVVDVKGKIMFNKAKYTNGNGGISVDQSSAQPISYAEFFRFMKRYGSRESFPLPIVVDRSSNARKNYNVSVGNLLDNSGGTNIVNAAALTGNSDSKMPYRTKDSKSIYHNNLYNGSAQFHFYGSKEDDVSYMSGSSNSIDDGLTVDLGPSAAESFDMLNNVFTVTADISKSASRDDRYWTFSALPNYDSINYSGNLESNTSSWKDQVSLNDSANGPIRIVRYEESQPSKSDEGDWTSGGVPKEYDEKRNSGGSLATSAKYNYAHGILAIDGTPNIDLSNADSDSPNYKDRKPSRFYLRAGMRSPLDYEGGGYGDITKKHIMDWLLTQYVNNLREYKISLNIGAYLIRYVTFSFSYVLDDDIQQQYTANGKIMVPAGYNSCSDSDKWYLPGNASMFPVKDPENVISSAESIDDAAEV